MSSSIMQNHVCPALKTADTQVPYYLGKATRYSADALVSASETACSVMEYVGNTQLGQMGVIAYSKTSKCLGEYFTLRFSVMSGYQALTAIRNRALNIVMIAALIEGARRQVGDPIQEQLQRFHNPMFMAALAALQVGAVRLGQLVDQGFTRTYEAMYYPYSVAAQGLARVIPHLFHALRSKETYAAPLAYLVNKWSLNSLCSEAPKKYANSTLTFTDRLEPLNFQERFLRGVVDADFEINKKCPPDSKDFHSFK